MRKECIVICVVLSLLFVGCNSNNEISDSNVSSSDQVFENELLDEQTESDSETFSSEESDAERLTDSETNL